MHVKIAVPDIHDECHRWFQRGNVRKVLFRSYAHIDTALLRCLQQFRNNDLHPRLVGEQIIRPKGAVLFGQRRGQFPKFLVRELRWCRRRGNQQKAAAAGKNKKYDEMKFSSHNFPGYYHVSI
jgi:hypothetical protein